MLRILYCFLTSMARLAVRSGRSKDFEIIVLRHQLAVLVWIRETEDRRKAAELRLRKMTTGEGMTATEIRELVERMQGIVAILQSDHHRRPTPRIRSRTTHNHLRPRPKTSETPRLPGPGDVEFRTCRRGVTYRNSTGRIRLDMVTRGCVVDRIGPVERVDRGFSIFLIHPKAPSPRQPYFFRAWPRAEGVSAHRGTTRRG